MNEIIGRGLQTFLILYPYLKTTSKILPIIKTNCFLGSKTLLNYSLIWGHLSHCYYFKYDGMLVIIKSHTCGWIHDQVTLGYIYFLIYDFNFMNLWSPTNKKIDVDLKNHNFCVSNFLNSYFINIYHGLSSMI